MSEINFDIFPSTQILQRGLFTYLTECEEHKRSKVAEKQVE
jgi:hypothetical protein